MLAGSGQRPDLSKALLLTAAIVAIAIFCWYIWHLTRASESFHGRYDDDRYDDDDGRYDDDRHDDDRYDDDRYDDDRYDDDRYDDDDGRYDDDRHDDDRYDDDDGRYDDDRYDDDRYDDYRYDDSFPGADQEAACVPNCPGNPHAPGCCHDGTPPTPCGPDGCGGMCGGGDCPPNSQCSLNMYPPFPGPGTCITT